MRRPLRLPSSLAEALMAHARAEQPLEACGLLSGDAATSQATRFHPARNAEQSEFVYSVDPGEAVRILDAVDEAGEELVAIFHSHPRSAAVPSATDRRDARWDGVLHLIASLAAEPRGARLRAWRIVSGTDEEVELRIE